MNHPLTYKELVLSYICDVWVYIDTTKSLLSKRILIQVLLSAQSMMHTSFPWCVKKCNMYADNTFLLEIGPRKEGNSIRQWFV